MGMYKSIKQQLDEKNKEICLGFWLNTHTQSIVPLYGYSVVHYPVVQTTIDRLNKLIQKNKIK